MKYSLGVNVLVGIAWMMVAGCGTSESSAPQETRVAEEPIQLGEKEVVETSQASLNENRNEYVKVIEGKLIQLNDDHAKLVVQAQQAGSGTQVQADLDTTLKDLTKEGKEVQQQIDELKAVKAEDWLALQSDMNQALEELAHSYEQALAKYAG